MIDFFCPDCNAKYRVPDDKAGKTAICKKCGLRLEIPMPVDPFAQPDSDLPIPPTPETPIPPLPEDAFPVPDVPREKIPSSRRPRPEPCHNSHDYDPRNEEDDAPRRSHASRRRPTQRTSPVAVVTGLAAIVIAAIAVVLIVQYVSREPVEQPVVEVPVVEAEPTPKPEPTPEPKPEPEPTYEPVYGFAPYPTEHYLLYGDGKPENKADLAMRLEAMYADYSREMQGVMKANGAKNLAFFFVDQTAHDATFAPQPAPPTGAVFWAPDPGLNDPVGPRLVLHRSIDNIHYEMTRLVQHEGWHQFNWNHVAEYSPVWLDEGLAYYYGNGTWTGDRTYYGAITLELYSSLVMQEIPGVAVRDSLFSLAQLMSLDDNTWAQVKGQLGFWAPNMQAWSLVYFLKHAEGGTHSHLLDAYIADVAAGRDTTDSANAIIALEPQWHAWVMSIQPTTGHAEIFESIAASLATHLARAHLNGQTFASGDDFLNACREGTLNLGPIGSDTWLPPSVMQQTMRYIDQVYIPLYEQGGYGALDVNIAQIDGVPMVEIQMVNLGLILQGIPTITDGKVTDITILGAESIQPGMR
jgi:hypothetical protein